MGTGYGLAGFSAGADDQAGLGQQLFQFPGQRQGRQDFPHGNAVQPDTGKSLWRAFRKF
jgi:hypothetical protein